MNNLPNTKTSKTKIILSLILVWFNILDVLSSILNLSTWKFIELNPVYNCTGLFGVIWIKIIFIIIILKWYKENKINDTVIIFACIVYFFVLYNNIFIWQILK